MKKLPQLKEEYQQFLDNIPQYISEVKTILGKDTLSYSSDEVNEVQFYYHRNYAKLDEIGLDDLRKRVKAYFGTAWLWHFGGKWRLETHKGYDTYGAICIEEYGGTNYPWVAMDIQHWLNAVERGDLMENLGDSFARQQRYQNLSPEYVLTPVRNIQ
ncbi:hypothetical protein [Flavobacterium sp.]|uniref:hypothetical protein n=1 Tax=Flavobacterium sp. TaxID=239 RepID=UPI0039E5C613